MKLKLKNIFNIKRRNHKVRGNLKVIVGLGNPGEKYRKNRHNIGFLICNEILKKLGNPKIELKFYGEISKVSYKNKEILIVKPLTSMNGSGRCVKKIIRNYSTSLDNLLIVHDDMDLNSGRIKFKKGGGSAGHKGVESIIDRIKDKNFCRLRIGIGRPPEKIDPVDYILQDFTEVEFKLLKDGINNITRAVIDYIEFDIKYVMSKYN